MRPAELLHQDDSTEGFLEWVSGLIVVQRTHAQWTAALESIHSIDFLRSQLTRTLLHETFHFYQIACTGWLYRFAAELGSAVAALIQTVTQDAASARRLLESPGRIDDPRIGTIVAALDRQAPCGLSVRTIVESAAYLFEFQAEYPDVGPTAFAAQRRLENLPEEYTAAYDLLRASLGDDRTYALMLPIAAAALCFDDPPSAFELGAERVAAGMGALPDDSLARVRWIVAQVLPDLAVIGASMDVAEQREAQGLGQHPVYFPAMQLLNERAGEVPPINIITEPRLMATQPEDYFQPALLKGGAFWIPRRMNAMRTELQRTAPALSLIAAYATQIQNRLFLPRPRAALS